MVLRGSRPEATIAGLEGILKILLVGRWARREDVTALGSPKFPTLIAQTNLDETE